MNRLAIAAVVCISLFSCKAEPQRVLTQTEIQYKVDSILALRAPEIKKQGAEDLDRRISIEVKVKADSLIQVCQQQTQQMQQVIDQPGIAAPMPSVEP
jgi:hypothetical protein